MARDERPDPEIRFTQAVEAVGLSDRHDRLRPLARPVVMLSETEPDRRPSTSSLSRAGGGPDLPIGMAWPQDPAGLHLNFLMQVDLADLAGAGQAPPETPLPRSGHLAFFCGADFLNEAVLHIPAGTPLRRHDLPADAQETADAVAQMVGWDGAAQRFMLVNPEHGDLTGRVEADGRLLFLRGDEPVLALASPYDISTTPQTLQVEPSLVVPTKVAAYAGIGLQYPDLFWEAVIKAMRGGRGPRHRMLGAFAGGHTPTALRASEEAARRGWTNRAAPEGWYVLLAMESGGRAGFCFGDSETLLFLAHAADTARGDFSRVVLFLDQG